MFGSPENRAIIALVQREESQRAQVSFGWDPVEYGRTIDKMQGIKVTSRNEDPVPTFLRNLSEAGERVLIAHHGLEPDVFNGDIFKGLMEQKLRDGFEMEILFSKKDAISPQGAAQMLREQNPVITALKQAYPEQLRLYWIRPYLQSQFLVVDDRLVMVAEPIHPREAMMQAASTKPPSFRESPLVAVAAAIRAGFRSYYEEHPLYTYSTVPSTLTVRGDRKWVQNRAQAFVEGRDQHGQEVLV